MTEVEINLGLDESVLPEIRDLNKELLVLRLSFGKLKAAIADAAAPVMAILVPALTKAVNWATRLVSGIGAVIAALLGIQVQSEEVTTTVRTTGKAIRRTLADFDQLQRLEGSSGGGSTTQTTTQPGKDYALPEELQQMVDTIKRFLQPLLELDFGPLRQSLATLGQAFSTFGSVVGGALEQLWFEVLAPLVAWVVETFAPAFMNTAAQGLEAVSAALAPLVEGFGILWQAMQPVVSFIGEIVIEVLNQLGLHFSQLSQVFTEKGQSIVGIFSSIGQVVSTLWNAIAPVLSALREQWGETFAQISSITSTVLGYVISALAGVTSFLSGVFTGDWGTAWEGIKELLRSSVNGIIGLLNVMLSSLTGAVNGIIRTLNKISFTVPDWVPGMGGKHFGFSLRTVTTPQIPYLAKGAVLPANKPFMAVVGDQRHGTNVEAPLSTIQEAVSVVLADQLGALQDGFSATVRELQQLRSLVSGIQVGDSVIGMAAQRYNEKMAVMRGGMV